MDDDYDEYNDYDEYDEYNDAADDWEAEAAELEAREKEVLEQKALIQEQKLQKRVKAPVRVKEEEEEEETLAADITRALIEMKEKASSVGEMRSLVDSGDAKETGSSVLIADMPVSTAEEAAALGEAIAVRVLQFAHSPHFNAMLAVLFHDLAQEFQSRDTLNTEVSRLHVATEEAKRRLKKGKRGKGARPNDEAAAAAGDAPSGAAHENMAWAKGTRDALGFDAVDDKGGAADASAEETFM